MYRRARQIIEPGIAELEVFTQLHAAAVQAAGKPLSAPLGNDFACGSMGGPPRAGRCAQAGEIYILDLSPWVDGYASDTCRAFAVNRQPTDPQLRAWETLVQSLRLVEKLARPGAHCREIFAAVDQQIRDAGYPPLPHHLGHGVGLQGHEAPHLNPHWNDVLLEGEMFAAEPGIYLPELAGGIRLENQYLVQAGGVVNFTPFALELA
jgi:Xaa-Pro aminopeptidase